MQNFDKMHINMLALQFKDFFFPKFCCHCGLSGDFLCEYCENSLKNIRPESFISRKYSNDWEIESELKLQTNLEKVYYFYEYSEIIHCLISEIKYQYYLGPIEKLAELIIKSQSFRDLSFEEIDFITFIPISKKKKLMRGFNHTEILTRNLSETINKPIKEILFKQKETKSQADLERNQRLVNLKESFGITNNLEINSMAKILIIDDICTTGSTLEEAAKTIKSKLPNAVIYGLCLARGKA